MPVDAIPDTVTGPGVTPPGALPGSDSATAGDVPDHPLSDDRLHGRRDDWVVDEWGRQSFPASDPPANW